MLWIRRIVFFLLIVIITSGYYVYNKTTAYLEQKEAQKYAQITARIWVATAKYNDNPERYREFRDSLLKAENMTKDDLNGYLKIHQSSPEKYLPFVSLIVEKIDSLALSEDSLKLPRTMPSGDSVLKIN